MSSQLLEYFKSLYYSPVTWALHFHPRLAEFFPHPQPLSSPTGVSGKHNIASSLAICSEVGEAEKIHQWVLWTFWRPRSASFFSINWGNQNLLPCHLRNKKSSLSIIVQYTLGACRNRVCVCVSCFGCREKFIHPVNIFWETILHWYPEDLGGEETLNARKREWAEYPAGSR